MNQKEILNCVTEIGYLMICYGSDVSRVEREVTDLCEAYEVQQVDVFAVPSSLVITISDGEDYVTKTRRITSKGNDMHKVTKLVRLCQWMKLELPEEDAVFERISKIKAMEPYHPLLVWIAYVVASCTSAIFYGAQYKESIVAGLIGSVIFLVQRVIRRFEGRSVFFTNLLCSCAASSLIAVAMKHFLIIHASAVMIGIIITMIPGIAMTNAMRNYINDDFIAGTIQILEAMAALLGIVGGIFLLIFLTDMPLI